MLPRPELRTPQRTLPRVGPGLRFMKALDCTIIQHLFFNLPHKTLLHDFQKLKDIIYSYPLDMYPKMRKSHKNNVDYTKNATTKEMLKVLRRPNGENDRKRQGVKKKPQRELPGSQGAQMLRNSL